MPCRIPAPARSARKTCAISSGNTGWRVEMPYVDPDPENWAIFKALPRDTPMHMLNLVRYRDRAEYPQGHPSATLGWSGERAYREYIERLLPFLAGLGAGLSWDGTFECVVTGPKPFEWDKVFVMRFPDSRAFFAMITAPEYKADIVPHRTAAVLDSRLVRYGGA
ncbi:MAG: DUF1330 domain-containing protein [Sphingomonadales bacterium]|nr:DUF1330 domain-containing protein [Sphingomonadales bacterium]